MKEENKEKDLKRFPISEILSSIDIIWKVLGFIIFIIGFFVFGGKIEVSYSLTDSEAVELIREYENAYYQALEVLEDEDYYTKGEYDYDKKIYLNQEIKNSDISDYYKKINTGQKVKEPKELKKIKKKVKKIFNNVVSDEIYNNIEDDIFVKNLYKDIETIKYSFCYAYNIDSEKVNFTIRDGNEIRILEPKFIREKRYEDGTYINQKKIGTFETTSRIIKVKKKLFIKKLYMDECKFLN